MSTPNLTLYLVRHGRTVYNTEHRLQGWCDSPLTPDGRAGVRVTAHDLRGRSFAAAYSSSSGRAVDTANEILAHHPDTPLTSDDDLREFSFGDLEATHEAELFARVDPQEMFGEVFAGTFRGLPGGEPAVVYLDRVRRGFSRIERAHEPGAEVLVVSHGVTLMAYLGMVGGRRLHPLPNASISTVEITPDRSRRITSLGLDPSGQGIPRSIVPASDPA
ncbi:histidine phosphatase family protein [Pengzhenrongella sp.]|uniref:histidine phosphatase family protein n=1 Tax=Pengzhenrongella sp. TaxID=2888820 RepID=UPI002F92749C